MNNNYWITYPDMYWTKRFFKPTFAYLLSCNVQFSSGKRVAKNGSLLTWLCA